MESSAYLTARSLILEAAELVLNRTASNSFRQLWFNTEATWASASQPEARRTILAVMTKALGEQLLHGDRF